MNFKERKEGKDGRKHEMMDIRKVEMQGNESNKETGEDPTVKKRELVRREVREEANTPPCPSGVPSDVPLPPCSTVVIEPTHFQRPTEKS